jgi:hypothetical protein
MAGADEFVRRTLYLEGQVGRGSITAGCEVNQAYAQNQHENLSFNHTVGRAHYLGGPLLESVLELVEGIARAAITTEGSRIPSEMRDVAEKMAGYVLSNAPRDPDIGDVLANSGSPYVIDEGTEVWRRPPIAPRRIGDDHSNW